MSSISGTELGAPSDDGASRLEEDGHDEPSSSLATTPSPPMAPKDRTDFAWRVHVAGLDWVARVDSKAWIALTLEIATLGTVVNLSADGRVLADLQGWSHWLLIAGAAVVVVAAVLAAAVVNPHLGRRRGAKGAAAQADLIYFGHLRRLEDEQISKGLQALTWDEQMGMLARQLKAVSTIAWRKHQLLRASLVLWLLGVLLMTGPALAR